MTVIVALILMRIVTVITKEVTIILTLPLTIKIPIVRRMLMTI